MSITKSGSEQEACPICGGDSAFIIEVDRPVVFLCACEVCGKFVIKEEVFERLLKTKSFLNNRKFLSRFVRDYFLKYERPLEIVLEKKESISNDSMTIEEILQSARYYDD